MITVSKYLVAVSLILSACSTSCLNEAEYVKWIKDKNNGLFCERKSSEVVFTAQFLPNEYLSYRELKSITANTPVKDNKTLMDSIKASYNNSISFLLTIGLSESNPKDIDIMKLNVSNYEEYKQRMNILNFYLSDYISLVSGDTEIKPKLCNLENVYGANKSRNINIVFKLNDALKKQINEGKLDLVFNDEIFNSGINHFIFKTKSLDKLPHINC